MVVYSGAGETGELLVFLSEFLEELSYFYLAHSLGQVIVALEADFLGHFCIECIERVNARNLEHLLYLLICMGKELVIHKQ